MGNSGEHDRRRMQGLAFEQALLTAAHRLTARLSSAAVCEALAHACEEIFGASCAVLLRHDQDRTLRCVWANGPFVGWRAADGVPMHGDEPAAVVFRSREPQLLGGGRHRAVGSRGALLYVPLYVRDRAHGVLVLDSPHLARPTAPRTDDLSRVSILAAQASIALSNAELYDESKRDLEHLRRTLEERRHLRGQFHALQRDLSAATDAGHIIGASAALKKVLAAVEAVASADTTVVLLGETGTGKELLARALHERSRRANKPFLPLNCAAMPPTLLEAELFGHERGAFTDALVAKAGKFELADGGTLFLDEIGDLPRAAQPKLLRALQEGEIQRIGGCGTKKVDVRVIAATNKDLQALVDEGLFRADLYYRLAVFPITVPPLRERPEDIPALARHFVQHFASRFGRRAPDIDAEALRNLMEYQWPGNVRELQNVIERAVILAAGTPVTRHLLALGKIP